MAEAESKMKMSGRVSIQGRDSVDVVSPKHNNTSSSPNASAQPSDQLRLRARRLRAAAHPITPEMQEQIVLLNELSNLIGLGTVEIVMPRRAMQGMEAREGWLWLELPETAPLKGTVEFCLYSLLSHNLARFTYRMVGPNRARVRVYALPEDVGRGCISRTDKSIKRSLGKLIDLIDVSKEGWEGLSVKRRLPLAEPEDESSSLFYMFNTLESPKPNPESPWIKDENTKDLLRRILGHRPLPGMKTTLYNYQRRSAAMMLQRELAPIRAMDSRLRTIFSPSGEVYYIDFVEMTLYQSPTYFDDVRGGILAEEMGAGKTICCLAVILATQHQLSAIPNEYSLITPLRKKAASLMQLSVSAIWRNAIPWRNWDLSDRCVRALNDGQGHYEIPPVVRSRSNRYSGSVENEKIYQASGTLIVCPANLIQQWRSEISKHVEEGRLQVLVLANSKAVIPTVDELLKYDIVLFSRTRFDQEAKDGKDKQGRREVGGVQRTCQCAYIGATRVPDCRCFHNDAVYKSPLKYIRWKRLIVDEGHSMGSRKTNGVYVTNSIHVERLWIVSGTPSSGLMGVAAGMNVEEGETKEEIRRRRDMLLAQRKDSQMNQDLDHFGRIVKDFLKLQPWAANAERGLQASWSAYITKGFSERCAGSITCVRNLLEGLVIRHRQEDIEQDVILPPLHHKIVLDLKPGFYEKLSMNLFLATLATNAVTSERKDRDYMFHSVNRGSLRQLVNNLLKGSSFYWCGFSPAEIESQVQVSKDYLAKHQLNDDDALLLRRSVHAGVMALNCKTRSEISRYQEMGYFLSDCPQEVATSWKLVEDEKNLSIFGATQVLEMQKHVNANLYASDVLESLNNAGCIFMGQYRRFRRELTKQSSARTQVHKRGVPNSSTEESKMPTAPGKRPKPLPLDMEVKAEGKLRMQPVDITKVQQKPKSILKNNTEVAMPLLPADSPLAKTRIIGTASRKLSYLLDQILKYHQTEKILIFYESEDVAFYIAQALEIVGIEYLAYAKTLNGLQKANYIVTFHQSETVRVLLMDLSQAAHGLNVSSASRIFFVNPVWQPNIEAQALKRAHRIGQMKPVYAETLVLQGTVEEALIKRRNAMSDKELDASKSNIMNDKTMRDIISNLQFLDVEETEGNELNQVARLRFPQRLFGDGKRGGVYVGDVINAEDYNDGLKTRRGPTAKRGSSPVRSDLVNTSTGSSRKKDAGSRHRSSNFVKSDQLTLKARSNKITTFNIYHQSSSPVSETTTMSKSPSPVVSKPVAFSPEPAAGSNQPQTLSLGKRKVGPAELECSALTGTSAPAKRKKGVHFS